MNKSQRTILNLLCNRGESYGLDLIGASDGVLARGTLYVYMQPLVDMGLVTAKIGADMIRQVYTVTSTGRIESALANNRVAVRATKPWYAKISAVTVPVVIGGLVVCALVCNALL